MSYDPSTVHPGAPLGASASFSSLPTSDIPAMGLGTFQAGPEGMMTLEAAVLGALDTGYRHIDTAWAYGDGDVERKVGEGLAKWMSKGGRREEIFVVTKLHNTFHDPKDVEVGLDQSLQNLGLDYVDLFLMHNPYAYVKGPDYSTIRRSDDPGKPMIDYELSRQYPNTWKAMGKLQHAGKTRMIGVSNFNIIKLQRLIRETGVIPAANQVEFNPYFPQYDLLNYCRLHQIALIAHCPLGGSLAPAVSARAGTGPLVDQKICAIASSHGCTAAQVILAWLLELGCAVVPKSSSVERIRANYHALEVRLTGSDMKEICEIRGSRGEKGIRNMVSAAHIGFDVYDETIDQPA